MLSPEPLEWRTHLNYLESHQLGGLETYIIQGDDDGPVGYCRIRFGDGDVAIAIDPSHWGKGYASRALLDLEETVRGRIGTLVAAIKSSNKASIRVFTKAKFTAFHKDDTLVVMKKRLEM